MWKSKRDLMKKRQKKLIEIVDWITDEHFAINQFYVKWVGALISCCKREFLIIKKGKNW